MRGRYVGPATEGEGALARLVHAPASAARPATLGQSTPTDYKRIFFDVNPDLDGEVVVHHAVEQQALRRYPGTVSESEMHSLENLRGTPKDINSDVNLSQVRREWNQFYRETPNPAEDQLLQESTEIDNKFGSQFNPPVR